MFDDDPFPEPFGPEYVRPANPDCPNCPCCTAPLCEKGRTNPLGGCATYANTDARETVRGCPCSAETTPGTAAHRAAEIRARKRLAARDERRFATPVEVLSVDADAGTASVIVVGWNITKPVAVPVGMLAEPTGLTAETLPGTWLEAEANCYAESVHELVLTDITIAPPLPEGWMGGAL